MIDTKELEAKSKSQFGKYVPEKPTRLMAFLGKYIFTKNTPRKSFASGMISAGVLVYWFFSKNLIPLVVWLVLDFLLTLGARMYWKAEGKRLDREMARLNSEIQQIHEEIDERKKYFENIREELARNSQN
ncbi:hypothetical protein RDn1_177 [Candidatus Termititenax dinenymphae]|uniref:Uncharacterized protein n=1 Tax=Candidatus Termititenax dinenymphae TaxID=2218523 RepID=A0A388TJN9_9BACT|nr:hypothetical protein RDn1_177 [Candidatus Termititenax dinenymphae]